MFFSFPQTHPTSHPSSPLHTYLSFLLFHPVLPPLLLLSDVQILVLERDRDSVLDT